MITDEIREELFSLCDEKYRDFQAKLIPTVTPDSVIGVRTPALKKMAKQYAKRDDVEAFLSDTPHKYFDENQLHAFILMKSKILTDALNLSMHFYPSSTTGPPAIRCLLKSSKSIKRSFFHISINGWDHPKPIQSVLPLAC